jgi:hypothetical protein
MAVSGNPAKRAAVKASSVADFKKNRRGKQLLLPSGLVMVCRRGDTLKTFIKQGDVPNALLPIIEEALAKGRAADLDKIVGNGDGGVDLDLINDMLDMVDKVVCSISIDPKVYPEPGEGEEVNDDLLYVDEIDEEDKMFLFQWSIGGTDDVVTFRKEAEEGLAVVAQGKVPVMSTESTSRVKAR